MYTSFRRISVHFVSISFSFYEKDLSSLYYDSLWMNGTFKLEKVLTKVMKKKQSSAPSVVYTFKYCFNPILHGGGVKSTPPGWLLYANPRGMPRLDWFFMTLFLSILERSWVGHFWNLFLKFPKKFASTIFFTYIPKGGPFYTCKNASIFGSFFWSKKMIIQLQLHR